MSWSVLIASSGVLGPFWGHLGPFWKRAGGVLGASGVRLRVSWEPPWPVLWASCERLGASWRHIVLDVHAKRSLNLGMPSQMPFLNRFVSDLASENRSLNFKKWWISIEKSYF